MNVKQGITFVMKMLSAIIPEDLINVIVNLDLKAMDMLVEVRSLIVSAVCFLAVINSKMILISLCLIVFQIFITYATTVY